MIDEIPIIGATEWTVDGLAAKEFRRRPKMPLSYRAPSDEEAKNRLRCVLERVPAVWLAPFHSSVSKCLQRQIGQGARLPQKYQDPRGIPWCAHETRMPPHS